VWRFSGSWSLLGTVVGSGLAQGCAVVGDQVLISGTTVVGKWALPSGPASLEHVDFSGSGTSGSSLRWFAIHSAIGLTSMGGDEKWIAERQPDAGWVLAHRPTIGATGPLRALAGRFAIEQFGAGDVVTLGRQALKRERDGGWAFQPDFGDLDVYGLWAEDDDTYWMVGVDNPGGTGVGVVFRARR
jgi:hypothetical protein